MLDWLQTGRKGAWEVRNFEVNKTDSLRTFMSISPGRYVPQGTYTGLFHDKRGVIMSDTRAEMRDLWEFEHALKKYPTGSVHIDGLGLGICTKMALDAGRFVEVVEIDQDVIELVGSQLLAVYKKLSIIHADALEYRPPKGTRYGMVWHDIWDEINLDNKPEYAKLNRRYGRLTNWQGSWAAYELRRQTRAGW